MKDSSSSESIHHGKAWIVDWVAMIVVEDVLIQSQNAPLAHVEQNNSLFQTNMNDMKILSIVLTNMNKK